MNKELTGALILFCYVLAFLMLTKMHERWWNRKNDKSDIFGDN